MTKTPNHRFFDRWTRPGATQLAIALILSAGLSGCNSIKNGWLDPSVVGDFRRDGTLEIRGSLSLEDTPPGLPGAAYPMQCDLDVVETEYAITSGDSLAVEINELRQRQVPYQAQISVTPTGYVNLPVVGRIKAAGLTVSQFEEALVRTLQERNVLRQPEVNVNPLFLQRGTYSIFGIGVSAADNAPLRAGSFPIRRPDLRLLEAINQIGGLNEFVTDIYIFRDESSAEAPGGETDAPIKPAREGSNGSTARNGAGRHDAGNTLAAPTLSAEEELRRAVMAEDKPAPAAGNEPNHDESLTPDAPAPFLYVNGEWVRNPAYQPAAPPATDVTVPGPGESITPSISWSRVAGETNYRIIRVPADPLRDGDPSVNVVVRAGDVIRIVSGEIGVYYVMGQVNRLGTFSFNAEKVTLKAAIAAAGGLSPLAWPDRCTVYRRLGQREQMIQVNLDRIFAGKDPDFLIKRGDIINVGTHPFAPFLQQIRAASLPTVVSNVGYSFSYARNYADIDSYSVRTNPHNQPDRFPNLFP